MGMDCKCVAISIAIAVVAIMIISLVSSSLKKIASDEVGLKYDAIWNVLSETPDNEGLHLGPVGFYFIKFPSVFQTLNFPWLRCLNLDGVGITLDVSFQYQARAKNLRKIVDLFEDHEGYEKVLTYVGQSAIHEACSRYNTAQFQAERGAFQETVRSILVRRYDDLWCDVTDLQVNNIQRPYGYEESIKGKEAARENIIVAQNERPRKITKAETELREADTQANITIAKAESSARIIINKAFAEAAAIMNEYETEASTYEKLVSGEGLSLNTEGFLSYVGVRVIANAQNPVYVGMKAPAKTSYSKP